MDPRLDHGCELLDPSELGDSEGGPQSAVLDLDPVSDSPLLRTDPAVQAAERRRLHAACLYPGLALEYLPPPTLLLQQLRGLRDHLQERLRETRPYGIAELQGPVCARLHQEL